MMRLIFGAMIDVVDDRGFTVPGSVTNMTIVVVKSAEVVETIEVKYFLSLFSDFMWVILS